MPHMTPEASARDGVGADRRNAAQKGSIAQSADGVDEAAPDEPTGSIHGLSSQCVSATLGSREAVRTGARGRRCSR